MTLSEEREIALKAILQAHLEGKLQHLIGDALAKNAVVLILLDVTGAVTISGDSRQSANGIRDRSMIEQMTKLLSDNMNNMMKEAGRKARDASTGN